MQDTTKTTPPHILSSARWIFSNHDLPANGSWAQFRLFEENDETRIVALKDRARQFVDALLIGPIRAASPLRLSDTVLRLRRDHGIPILTTFHEVGNGANKARVGVYSLGGKVERVEGRVAA